MSLYDVNSLSSGPSLSTAILSEVISLSNLSGLIAILPPSFSSIILQCPNMPLCSDREKLLSLLSCEVSQSNAVRALNASPATISVDTAYLREHARDYLGTYDEYFAEEYKQCIDFLREYS
jgi:hypothetical protein